jgi:hypothetical protein
LVLLQVGPDLENFDSLLRCTSFWAEKYLFGILLLALTLYFQLGSGSGPGIIKYPICGNTWPVAATVPFL